MQIGVNWCKMQDERRDNSERSDTCDNVFNNFDKSSHFLHLLKMFDKSVKVWMRESVWKCKRVNSETFAQNMPTFAPKARMSTFIWTRTAYARPSSLKKTFTFSSVLLNLFLWLHLILTSGAVLHLHLGWYYSCPATEDGCHYCQMEDKDGYINTNPYS